MAFQGNAMHFVCGCLWLPHMLMHWIYMKNGRTPLFSPKYTRQCKWGTEKLEVAFQFDTMDFGKVLPCFYRVGKKEVVLCDVSSGLCITPIEVYLHFPFKLGLGQRIVTICWIFQGFPT